MRMLVTGPQGCGKTTFCQLVIDSARRDGSRVGGVLVPAVSIDGCRVGADAVDLVTSRTVPMTRLRSRNGNGVRYGDWWAIMREGLDLAREALERAIRQRFDLIVVDGFGPLELAGGGICEQAIDAWNSGRDVVLVARSAIADEAIAVLGRLPDLRVVPETPPIERESVLENLATGAALIRTHDRPVLMALM